MLIDVLLERFHRLADYGFAREWEDIPPDERTPTLWFLVAVGGLLGGVMVLALLWIQSVML